MTIPFAKETITDGALGITQGSGAKTMILIGVCSLGVPGTLQAFGDSTSMKAALGNGPLVEQGANVLDVSKSPHVFLPILASVAGGIGSFAHGGTGTGTVAIPALSTVTSAGTSPPAVTLTGTPTKPGAYSVQMTTGGAVATAAFSWSIDGVQQGAGVLTASTVVLPGAGLTLNFAAGTYNTNNIYSFIASAPLDEAALVVTVVNPGAVGTATFTYSLDGGVTTSPRIATAATYPIAGAGLTLAFSGTFVAGDTYSSTITPPGFTATDLTNAIAAIVAMPLLSFALIELIGQAANVSGSAAMAAALSAGLDTLNAQSRYCRAIMECAVDTDANIQAAFVNFVDKRICIAASTCTLASALTGRSDIRPAAWPLAARAALKPPAEALHRVESDSLARVTAIQRDESLTQALDAARFLTLRTWSGLQGFYATSSVTMAANGSDFSSLQNGQVMDIGATIGHAVMAKEVGDTLRTNPASSVAPLVPGAIDDRDANAIVIAALAALKKALLASNGTQKPAASDVDFVINRTTNVISTRELLYSVRIQPDAYSDFIQGDYGFVNPALSALSAALPNSDSSGLGPMHRLPGSAGAARRRFHGRCSAHQWADVRLLVD